MAQITDERDTTTFQSSETDDFGAYQTLPSSVFLRLPPHA